MRSGFPPDTGGDPSRGTIAEPDQEARRDLLRRAAVRDAPLILWAIDPHGTIVLAEGRGLAALGYRGDDLIGRAVSDPGLALPLGLAAVSRALAGETSAQTLQHGEQIIETRCAPGRDQAGAITHVIGVSTDITARARIEQELRARALHDPVTGLPNRALFLDRVKQAQARGPGPGATIAVLLLDLDRLKVVTDYMGREAGDRLLVGAAERIARCVRASDTVARLGGDEFAILLTRTGGGASVVARIARRILDRLQPPITIEGLEIAVAASVGIALSERADDDPDELVRQAEAALHRAKAAGRNRYEVFDPQRNAEALTRLELEADLRRALERDELRVRYQPKVDLATGRIAGAEALIRWEHPRRGLIYPRDFIPLAEETGLIVPLGQWVLEEACRQCREWQRRHPRDPQLTIDVNLSVRQLGEGDIVASVARTLLATGLPPHTLGLELTESVVMHDTETTAGTLQRLKALGVQLIIDDFGTGYSSLAYLKHVPVNSLKLNGLFVGGLGHAPEDEAIVGAIVALARALGLAVTGEFVETATQAARLRALGCHWGQGDHFSPPLPEAAFDALLAEEGTGQ